MQSSIYLSNIILKSKLAILYSANDIDYLLIGYNLNIEVGNYISAFSFFAFLYIFGRATFRNCSNVKQRYSYLKTILVLVTLLLPISWGVGFAVSWQLSLGEYNRNFIIGYLCFIISILYFYSKEYGDSWWDFLTGD